VVSLGEKIPMYNRIFFLFDCSVLDARVLVDIALLIEERTRHLQIPWSWSDFQGYTWTNKAFKKRTGTSQQSVNS
jgi:hypothetical protein